MIQTLAELIRMFGEFASYVFLAGLGMGLIVLSLMAFKDGFDK